LDRDPDALRIARTRLARFEPPIEFVRAPFSTLAAALSDRGISQVSAIVADLGVSSLQLDSPQRGFSFRHDGPLDMRMDPQAGLSAADLLATIDVPELTRVLRDFGEEPDAGRIARAIVAARPRTTGELTRVVEQAMSAPQRRKLGLRIHPATRTFQALRIRVNAELEQLDRFLADAPGLLTPGGRLAVITFHSLEDRPVKQRFRALGKGPELPPHLPLRAQELPQPEFRIPRGYAAGMTPSEDERATNPRARSARLRVLERSPRP
jgi:16S rRNA (cytosine1402-N4)-methyltransferase